MSNGLDVIIVGAGPAGIFAALELLSSGKPLDILMLEKGSDLPERRCPLMQGAATCASCHECSVISGWGGAGAFSDGKLGLSPDVGGFLERYMSRESLIDWIELVDEAYLSHGAPPEVFGKDSEALESIRERAAMTGLEFIPARIRHMGTDRCLEVLASMEEELRRSVDIRFGAQVDDVIVSGSGQDRKVRGVRLDDGQEFYASFVVLAPGREGSKWLEGIADRLGLETLNNPVDIGVRVEVPASVLEPLTSVTYEPKIVYESKSFHDRVRTFCVNPYGEVVKEHLKGVWTVNGHSYAGHKTGNTNFALLVSSYFTEPFNEPISYGRHIAELANYLGAGVLVQRLGDLRSGRRSTDKRVMAGSVRPTLGDATAGDLSYVLPYRHMCSILEMLEAMDSLAPGINAPDTLLYGLEVKFYSLRLMLTDALETNVDGLYAAGDGAGVSRGLVQASVSGAVVARDLETRLSRMSTHG